MSAAAGPAVGPSASPPPSSCENCRAGRCSGIAVTLWGAINLQQAGLLGFLMGQAPTRLLPCLQR